jgi:hypothetical protein
MWGGDVSGGKTMFSMKEQKVRYVLFSQGKRVAEKDPLGKNK